MYPVDSITCENMKANAKKEIDSIGFLIPSVFYFKRTSKTFKEILLRKYKFNGVYQISGCITPTYLRCYEEGLIDSISNYYGENFLDSINHYCDSLDRIGKGFLPPKFPVDSINIFNVLKICIYGIPLNMELMDTLRLLHLSFNEKGELYSKKYYEGYNNVSVDFKQVKNHTSKMIFDILDNYPQWTSASLEGKPITADLLIPLHPHYPIGVEGF